MTRRRLVPKAIPRLSSASDSEQKPQISSSPDSVAESLEQYPSAHELPPVTLDPASYVETVKLKKYGNNYRIRYMSPLTGKMKRLELKVTGRFSTRELAEEWAAEHLPKIIKAEIAQIERQTWRTFPTLMKRVAEYKAYKLKKAPRSARQDLSMLTNMVLPYFAVIQGLKNPQEWFRKHKRFKAWLLDEEEGAKTTNGEPISVSTANKAINALNKFGEWLVDFEYIEEADFRPLKAYPANMQNRKGADDLIDEQEFSLIWERLRKELDPVWADLWLLQYWTGMRINEAVGLTMNFLAPEAPEQVQEAFDKAGLKIFGVILLDSQPSQDHIKRVGYQIPRAPLKWRSEISPRNSRVIPIVNKELWNILARRHEQQMRFYDRNVWGENPAHYLLFDGAQKLKYTNKIIDAYEKVGIENKGSHALRHTRITEWTALNLPDKIMELVFGNKAQAREGYIHLVELVNRRAQEKANLRKIKTVS